MLSLKLEGLPVGLKGLIYIVEDDRVITQKPTSHQWLIDIYDDGQVSMQRFYGGQLRESYLPVSPAVAGVALVAIVNGYQPPHGLDRLEKVFDEKPPESGSASAA